MPSPKGRGGSTAPVKPGPVRVSVTYGDGDDVHVLPVRVDPGATIERAIRASGILERCPGIDLTTQKVGIYNRIRSLGERVEDGDRIEIYRPLTIDPKDARRRRAAGQKSRGRT